MIEMPYEVPHVVSVHPVLLLTHIWFRECPNLARSREAPGELGQTLPLVPSLRVGRPWDAASPGKLDRPLGSVSLLFKSHNFLWGRNCN